MGHTTGIEDELAGRRRAVGVGMLIAASVLWSLSGVVVKYVQLNPITFALFRSVGAMATMALLLPFSSGSRPPWRWLALCAVVHTLVVSTLVAAMTLSTAAAGILLQYTAPAFCALFAWVFQRRGIDRRTLLAMVIASAGIGVILFAADARSLRGNLLGILSGAAFGALILLLEKMDRVAGGKANPFLIVACNNGGTAMLLFPLSAYLGILAISPGDLGIVMATGMIQLAIPYVLFQLSLRRVHPVDASLLILLEPVLNPIWVAMVVGERADGGTMIGGAAILIALVIEATKPTPRRAASPSPSADPPARG